MYRTCNVSTSSKPYMYRLFYSTYWQCGKHIPCALFWPHLHHLYVLPNIWSLKQGKESSYQFFKQFWTNHQNFINIPPGYLSRCLMVPKKKILETKVSTILLFLIYTIPQTKTGLHLHQLTSNIYLKNSFSISSIAFFFVYRMSPKSEETLLLFGKLLKPLSLSTTCSMHQ